ASFSALAEESSAVITVLEGEITDLTEEGFLMEDAQLGQVYVLYDDETVFDGVAAKDAMSVGQYVFVDFDGRLTRSLPPQAVADRVGVYTVSGTITELLDEGYLVDGDPVFGQVMVHPGENQPHAWAGAHVTVYYNGVMAMSLPGQISSSKLVAPTLEGTISNLTDAGFTLTDAQNMPWDVQVSEGTLLTGELADGAQATVYYSGDATKSIPAQVNAFEVIVPEADDAELLIEVEEAGEEATETEEPTEEPAATEAPVK
ncbi:MAG: hypothetical protein PHY12_06685, partial [Eubacteriales bacterium]|nr:hypothetical protein [Eubacteriales bacterium]